MGRRSKIILLGFWIILLASFVYGVEPIRNLANETIGATIERFSSELDANNKAERILEDPYETSQRWITPNTVTTWSVTIDLGVTRWINETRIFNANQAEAENRGFRITTIYYSKNQDTGYINLTTQELLNASGVFPIPTNITFTPIEARYFNFTAHTVWSGASPAFGGLWRVQIINTSSPAPPPDTTPPHIDFVDPTPPDNNSTFSDNIYINISSNDSNDHYSFLNFDNSLVAWYRLEHDALDNSTSANHGIINGTDNITGIYGDAISFDGIDDYIEAPDDDSLSFGDGITDLPFSISAWINMDDATRFRIAFKDSSATIGEYFFTFSSTDNLNFGLVGTNFNHRIQIISDANFTASENEWHHVTASYNGNGSADGMKIYFDGNEEAHTQSSDGNYTAMNNTNSNLNIGKNELGSVGYSNGSIDEIIIFGRELSQEEILSIINSTANQYEHNFTDLDPDNYTYVGYAVDTSGNINNTEIRTFTVLPITSQIDLIFRNTTDDEKTTFAEGENFFGYINFTLINGSIIDDSVGICNMTFIDGLIEIEANNSNFTLCNNNCDIDTNFTREFDMETTDYVVEDMLHFTVCHDAIPIGGIDFLIQCGASSENFVLDASEFSICSLGETTVSHTFTTCIGSRYMNVSSVADNPFIQRKRIIKGAIDRKFSQHILTYPEDIFFNLTLGLWRTNHSVEYYEHQSATIFGNCSYTPDSDLDRKIIENITIVNIPPEIIFSGVTTDLGFTINADPLIIEYSDGIWNWSGTVIDDDLDHFNVTWYNSSGHVIQENLTLVNNTLLLTSTQLFAEFANPYNISVSAIDSTNDTTYLNRQFNVTDTVDPVCTGFDNTTITNNSFYVWNVLCTDEYFWQLSIDCDNGFNFTRTSIGEETFNFINQTLILGNTLCLFNYSDAHTGKLIKDFDIRTDIEKGELNFQNIPLTISEPLKDITWTKKFDRYNFCFETDNPTDKITVIMPEECIEAKNSGWNGHFVCSESYWVDFENYPVTIQGQNVIIDVSKEKGTEHCFDSIGILNTVSGEQLILSVIPPIGDTETREFETTPQALFWMFLIIFWFASLIAFLTLRGKRGHKIQLLNLMQCFLGIVVGIGWMSRFNVIIGLIIILVSGGIFYGFAKE